MENQIRHTDIDSLDFTTASGVNKLLRASFSWMALAMLLTSLSAMLFAFVPQLSELLIVQTPEGAKLSIFAYVVMFAPLIFVLGINFGLNKLSFPALIGLFIAYSIVNGISLSFIFFVYNILSFVQLAHDDCIPFFKV